MRLELALKYLNRFPFYGCVLCLFNDVKLQILTAARVEVSPGVVPSVSEPLETGQRFGDAYCFRQQSDRKCNYDSSDNRGNKNSLNVGQFTRNDTPQNPSRTLSIYLTVLSVYFVS
jgi:hypothetical protein